MARNFYKSGGSYYYSDNNQKIFTPAELQAAAKAGGKEVPPAETQESVDNRYKEELEKTPEINKILNGGSTLDDIMTAYSTGNWSGVVDEYGQPFSAAEQVKALENAREDNRLYYESLQAKDKAATEAKLAKSQADYQDYLINTGQSFESDKTATDQKAADSGVLFSGSRVQKEKNLQRAYEQDQATTLRKTTAGMAEDSRLFQNDWGNDQSSGLNKYYNLGSNSFNPNKAIGGVSSNGLSSVYSPSSYDPYKNSSVKGSKNIERSSAAAQRAAGKLWNKGNKLLATSYQNNY